MIPNQLPAPNVRAPASKPHSLSPEAYAFLQQYIYSGSGIIIEPGKQYLLESRLQSILRDNHIDSLDALSGRLAAPASGSLGRQVIEAMTTNETLFFRDPQMFDALRQHLVPSLLARFGGTRKLRIWSAAASTGQEAYSLAMMMLDMGFGAEHFEIIGTDIATHVIDRAREGRYTHFDVNRGLPPVSRLQYFTREGLAWQLHQKVRRLVRFEQLDLRSSASSLGHFDLILCRNVLIYFDHETKKRIVASIRDRLHPGGVLVLGCAETVINIHDGFERRTIGQSTFYSV